ncbi:hypothetical protein RUM43_000349 [Polyplax serrata]|uniref:Ig-like domain-containing protein n=1 Tax=Polyplax serrata TaxID=468196 RepID=A0AAN8SD87_POLSC
MTCILILFIAMQSVNCLTTDDLLTMTLDQTTEITFPINSTFSTIPATPTSKLALPTMPPTKAYKAKDYMKTDAPMLNYIFDTHSSKGKHHHHDTYKWGPHFDPSDAHLNGSTVTVQVGDTAILNCKVNFLQDKTQISWMRRKENNELQLLTVGRHTYSGDDRYTLEFQYPGNWRLQIKFVSKNDEGLYECQISTHPPKVTQTFLYINAPEVVIVDEHGVQLLDKYYESDSTIQLSCIVRHVAMTSSVVLWMHGNRILNYDLTRGGISVRTELKEAGANSTLSVAKVNKTDSGNYTCSISKTEFATVAVHVLNEESLAELHHGSQSSLYTVAVTFELKLLLKSFILIFIMR